jgi:carbon storage regulator
MALTLSRKSGEWIRIGDVRVDVVKIQGNRVKLAITAPPQVRIVRGEIEKGDNTGRQDRSLL